SQLVLKSVKECGINEDLFCFHDRSLRNLTVACSYPTDRAFIAFYDPAPKIRAWIKALPKVKAKWIMIPGLFTGQAFNIGASILRKTGSRIIMDGNCNNETNYSRSEIDRALKAIDIFLPNETEVIRLTGNQDALQGMIELSAKCNLVVMKAGAMGAYTYINGSVVHIPGIPVNPMDTTGAGDNFNAGFIKGILEGKNIIESIQMGNIVGGLSTEILGGSGRMVTSEEISTWMEYYKG
ncbi:MAG: carbohydrate kinase family protein, partial [Anaerolineaceae bacterium]|nr:carbohydrate kinase family protein [Anaerolineaceae bacterium]